MDIQDKTEDYYKMRNLYELVFQVVYEGDCCESI